MSNGTSDDPLRRAPKWRRILAGSSLVMAGVAGGAFAQAAGSGPGWGPGGRDGEAMMRQRAERVLSSVDATSEQRERIGAIMGAAARDLAPMRASFGDARGAFAAIMTTGRIDRDAAERLRADRLAAADSASKRTLTAALDAAEVLTPEQRAQLKSRFDARAGR